MALVAWYPLNGNLEDYSGNGNHLSNNNTANITVNNSGKIGKCYNFTGTGYLSSAYAVKLSGDITFCSWVYVDSTNAAHNQGIVNNFKHGGSGGYNTSFCVRSTGVLRLDIADKNGNSHTAIESSGVIARNAWQHVAVTFNTLTGRAKFYINGSFNSEKSFSSNLTPIVCKPEKIMIGQWGWSYATAYNYKGRLNDVRIYNEALSLKEIKEISKAKILHYNFNTHAVATRNEYGNNIFQTSSSGGGFNHWGQTGHIGSFGQNTDKSFIYNKSKQYSHWVANNTGATGKYLIYLSPEYAGGYRSIQAIIKMSDGSEVTNEKCHPDWNDNNTTYTKSPFKWSTIKHLGDGFYLCKCEELYQNGSNDLIGIYVRAGYKIYISEFKVENTQFCSDINIYDNLPRVTDSSGFRNHSQPLGLSTTPQWVSDSIFGDGCYKFNSTNKIVSNQLFFDNRNQEWTVTGWAKLNVNNKTQSVNNFNLSNRLTSSTTQKALLYLNDGAEDSYVYSATTMPVNKWYHFAFVANTSNLTCKYYHNGVLNASSSNYTSSDFPQGFSSTTVFGEGLDGYLDDIRVYATALSDEDIKELYQSKGSVVKNGKVMVNELNEAITYNPYCKGENLVRNGYGENASNTNMGGVYIASDSPTGSNGSFEYTGNGTVLSSDYIKISHSNVYEVSAYIKSMKDNNSYFMGVACYDKDKRFINYEEVTNRPSSRTTLAKALNNGDTVVYLTSSSGWYVGTQGQETHEKTFGVYDRPEATNYERYRLSARYLNIDTTNHTITLKSAWNGGTIPVGTKVANAYSGGNYNYILGSGTVPMGWTKKTATITGLGAGSGNVFRHGTEYIKFLLLCNYGKDSTFKMRLGSISIVNKTMIQHPEFKITESSVNKKGQLITNEIVEYNYKPSLIDYSTWTLGTNLPSGWYNNGSSSENTRVVHKNPKDNLDMMWATLCNDIDSGADGGFHSPMVNIDKTKKYRFSVWIRRENVGNGRTYFGCYGYDSSGAENGLLKLDGTAVTNPYFTNFLKTESYGMAMTDNWALLVAYIHPNTYSGGNQSDNGVYKKDGTRVGGITDYKWSTTASKTRSRAYLYYSTSTDEKQYYYRPRIDLCDGTEPSIKQLLSCTEHIPLVDITGKQRPKNVFSLGKDGNTYATEFIEN